MADNMKVHGEIIKCMAEVFSFGLMVVNMKDNILMIKKKDMANLVGQMVVAIKVNGKTGNKMVKELIEINKVYRKMEHGLMVKR
jgi:hypothetical protein